MTIAVDLGRKATKFYLGRKATKQTNKTILLISDNTFLCCSLSVGVCDRASCDDYIAYPETEKI